MRNGDSKENNVPHVTKGSVLDDLGFSPSEALEIKVKAEIYRELLEYIREQGFSAQKLAVVLGMHQPDVSNLLNGKIAKFSVGKLIQCAGKLQLGAQVTLTKPKARRRDLSSASVTQGRVAKTAAQAKVSRKTKASA
jgi:predicted XRE-type DNA-binding protein